MEAFVQHAPHECCQVTPAKHWVRCGDGPPQSFCSRFCMVYYGQHGRMCQECEVCGTDMSRLPQTCYAFHPTRPLPNNRIFMCGSNECQHFMTRQISNTGNQFPTQILNLLRLVCPDKDRQQVCAALELRQGSLPEAPMELLPRSVCPDKDAALGLLGTALATLQQGPPARVCPVRQGHDTWSSWVVWHLSAQAGRVLWMLAATPRCQAPRVVALL
jgi:hypothetical protein